MFTLNRADGVQLLASGEATPIVIATLTADLAIVALVAGVGGWITAPANGFEQALLVPAVGLLL